MKAIWLCDSNVLHGSAQKGLLETGKQKEILHPVLGYCEHFGFSFVPQNYQTIIIFLDSENGPEGVCVQHKLCTICLRILFLHCFCVCDIVFELCSRSIPS